MKPKIMALSGAASLVAWGYLFLYFNLNLGPVDVLPNWLGYGMMLRALPALGRAVPAAALLRPLASMLAGWQGLLWVLPILGIPTAGPVVSLLALVFGVVAPADREHPAGDPLRPAGGLGGLSHPQPGPGPGGHRGGAVDLRHAVPSPEPFAAGRKKSGGVSDTPSRYSPRSRAAAWLRGLRNGDTPALTSEGLL